MRDFSFQLGREIFEVAENSRESLQGRFRVKPKSRAESE